HTPLFTALHQFRTEMTDGSTDDQAFKVKSVAAQQNVTLECPREKSLGTSQYMYWIRIIPGHQPEFLGGTMVIDFNDINKTPHFTTKQEPGTFILHIHQTQNNDTGLYYCIRTSWNNMSFLRGVFLEVQAEPASSDQQVKPRDEKVVDLKYFYVNKVVTFVHFLLFLQRDEALLTYSAPTFSRRKVTKSERGNTHSVQKETVYSDVRFHH
uniref:Ig-like domain-containing protein n=1 Tax=Salarias fasciatus TaxID=181472 RepID=A0A672IND4_SALFA